MVEPTQPLVLGILGSPRRKSNTGVLLERMLAGAQAVGAEVEQVALRDLDFCSCRHYHPEGFARQPIV